MNEQQAWKELAKVAEARARGATVTLRNEKSPEILTISAPGDHIGLDARSFISFGWRINDIAEPTVLRDWTAEDAKKHVGFAYRTAARIGIIGVLPDGNLATDDHVSYWRNWGPDQYATPIPGTDPAKWDWKPCKVEVPAEGPKADSVAIASIRNALTAMVTCRDWRNLNRPIIMGWINDALFSLESP